MSIFQNQTYKRKLQFVHNDDENKMVTVSFSIQTNHDLDKSALQAIEDTISDVFLESYQDRDVIAAEAKERDQAEKDARQAEKERLRVARQNEVEMRDRKKEAIAQEKRFKADYDRLAASCSQSQSTSRGRRR